MKRREFIAGLGGAAAWPLAARAQRSAMPVIGFLDAGSLETRRDYVTAFHRSLAENGYIEGRNVSIEYRWAEFRLERLSALANDLVRLQVAVIVATGTPAAVPAKAATTSIPIVFAMGGDPIEAGLVQSLNRPGGNLTGVSSLSTEVAAKRLELLHELAPAAISIAVFVNPANVVNAERQTKELQAAARTLGVHLLILKVAKESEFETAFATLVRERAGAVLFGTDPLFFSQSDRLIALAARHRVPAVYTSHEAVAAGGLISYGTDVQDGYRMAGVYAGRILKGEKPADLPVQRATRTQLWINLKSAKEMGLTVPTGLLLRADEVIE
jgi:putative ABC transport system substrate-binding protein